jgi:hypothetical protein
MTLYIDSLSVRFMVWFRSAQGALSVLELCDGLRSMPAGTRIFRGTTYKYRTTGHWRASHPRDKLYLASVESIRRPVARPLGERRPSEVHAATER